MDAPKILDLRIADKHSLYKLYMPYLIGGGLFLPTSASYNMGDDLFILLELPDSPDRFGIAGKIIWITPSAAQNKRLQGIGLQFSEGVDVRVKARIEDLLAGTIDDSEQTLAL